MKTRTIFILSMLVLITGACSLTQLPSDIQDTPIVSIDTPTLPAAVADTPTPPANATTVPVSTLPSSPVGSSPTLVKIAFLDASNGWGIAANDGGSILRTADGGASWVNVTPPGLTGLGLSTDISVLNVNTVWVLVPNADFFTGKLYRTTDGGLTWATFDAPFGGAYLQFLDGNTGRALADLGAGAGSQAVEMFQTSDGGATWLSVFNNDPGRPDSSGSLPLGGIKNGMTFLDANTGWVTGTRPMDGDVYLFVTHDGGVSWEQQSIPLPAGYESYQYMPQAPVFFGNDGFLPLVIYLSGTTDFTFYTTHDGGTTWTGDPNNATRVVTPGRYTFTDSLHGWSWDGGSNFYFTNDGTQIWGGMAASLDLSDRLAQLEFVPASIGQFTGWALTGTDDAGHSQLYRTADNGSSWTPLIP